ncbi:MAG: hypothetical protein ACK4Z4_17175 [Ferrovibrio sp.]
MRKQLCAGVLVHLIVLVTVPSLAASDPDPAVRPGEITDTRQDIRAVIPAFAGSLVDVSIDFASSQVASCYRQIDTMPRRQAMTDVCIALDVALAMWVQALYDERPKAYAREMKVTPNEFGDAALGRALEHLQGRGLERQVALQRAIELGGIAYRDLLAEVNVIMDRQARQPAAKPR